MASVNNARKAIYDRFITQWANRTPFTFDNETFDPPDNGQWARLVVRNTGSAVETIGRKTNRRFNRRGSIIVSIFSDVNDGLSNSDTFTQAVRDIFEGESFDGVYANDAVVREVGEDGKWFQVNVEIFFFYEEIK